MLRPSRPGPSARLAAIGVTALALTFSALPAMAAPAAAASVSTAVPTLTVAAKARPKPARPTGVKVRTNSYGKFEAGWNKAKHATLYRVYVFADKARTKLVMKSTFTTKTHKWIQGPKIKENTRYYFVVRAFNTKSRPGPISVIRSVKTKTLQSKTPQNVAVKALDASSIHVSWSRAQFASGYTVSLRATKTGAPFWSKRVTGTTLDVRGITSRRMFFVTVTSDRLGVTRAVSKSIAAATAQSKPAGRSAKFQTSVASYNVLQYNKSTPAYGTSFLKRAPHLASRIKDYDIVGVQEITWGTMTQGSVSFRPILSLASRAGLTLGRHTVDGRSTSCSINSVHILFDDAKYDLVRCGSKALGSSRYMVWDVLRESASGQQVLVVNTHLTNGSTSAADKTRAAQATTVAAEIQRLNPDAALPVILTGDLNSFHGRATTTPMSVLVSKGFYPSDLVAPTVVNGQYASAHAFGKTGTNRTHIDHIMTSGAVTTSYFKIRVETPERSLPSDHHLVWAKLTVFG